MGAFHNDFSYNPEQYENPDLNNEQAVEREKVNRMTNLFMRKLYQKAITDQTSPGDLYGFLRRTPGVSLDSENGVWKVDTELLQL